MLCLEWEENNELLFLKVVIIRNSDNTDLLQGTRNLRPHDVQSIGTQAEFLFFSHLLWCSGKNLLIDTVGKNLRGHAVYLCLSTYEDTEAKKDFLKFN